MITLLLCDSTAFLARSFLHAFETEWYVFRFTKSQGGMQHPRSALWILQPGKLRHGAAHNCFTVPTTREIPETGKVSGSSGGRVLSPSLLACHAALPRSVWARVVRIGVYLPFTTSHARAGCGKSTHAHAHRHTRTHKALCNLCRHSAERQTALTQPEKAPLKLARRPPWAPGWGCSERGLCPSLALFQAALSLSFFPPHTLHPHTLLPSLSIHPFSPSNPEAQIVLLGFPRKRGHPQL